MGRVLSSVAALVAVGWEGTFWIDLHVVRITRISLTSPLNTRPLGARECLYHFHMLWHKFLTWMDSGTVLGEFGAGRKILAFEFIFGDARESGCSWAMGGYALRKGHPCRLVSQSKPWTGSRPRGPQVRSHLTAPKTPQVVEHTTDGSVLPGPS